MNGGRLDVSLNDGTWRVTGDSGVDKLSLDNGTVDLASMAPVSGDFTMLNMADLDGSGTFIMRTDVKGGAGDLLRVTGTSAGSHILTVRNQGDMTTDAD